jgi:hypothetical protein
MEFLTCTLIHGLAFRCTRRAVAWFCEARCGLAHPALAPDEGVMNRGVRQYLNGVMSAWAASTAVLVAASLANAAVHDGVIEFLLHLHVAVLGYTAWFVAVLCANLPTLAALTLLAPRLPRTALRAVAAVSFLLTGEWIVYRIEWSDVWRHGVPPLGYWATVVVPFGLACAVAGFLVAGALRESDPAERPVHA